jgi:hypothetical protein
MAPIVPIATRARTPSVTWTIRAERRIAGGAGGSSSSRSTMGSDFAAWRATPGRL